MSEGKKRHLVLIGGYGRSGSTILDLNIAKRFNGLSLGEIRFGCTHIENNSRLCSCSEEFKNCLFWSRIIQSRVISPISTLQYASVLESVILLFNGEKRSKVLEFHNSLFENNVESNLIIDSSKTGAGAFLRPYILSKILKGKYEVHFVGLYRHPASVYKSIKKGDNEILASGNELVIEGKRFVLNSVFLKILLSWSYSNIAVLVNHLAFSLGKNCSQIHSIERLSSNLVSVELRGLTPISPKNEGIAEKVQIHSMGGNRLIGSLDNRDGVLSPSKASGVGDGDQNRFVICFIGVLLSPILGLLRIFRK